MPYAVKTKVASIAAAASNIVSAIVMAIGLGLDMHSPELLSCFVGDTLLRSYALNQPFKRQFADCGLELLLK